MGWQCQPPDYISAREKIIGIMKMSAVKKYLHNPLLQWFFILLFLIAIRGSEGLGEPVSIDVNDTIVFSEILSNPSFPPESISAQFIQSTKDTGLAVLPGKLMHDAGIPPRNQFLILYAVQMAVLSLGLLVFFSAFGRNPGYIFLAVLIAYLSAFTGFGRYLAIAAGFKIVSSGMALAVGFLVLGLHLQGKRYAAAIAAALLAAYHPTHGFVLLSMLGMHALWETYTRRQAINDLFRLGAVTLAALMPFIWFIVLRLPVKSDFDHAAWWSYVFNKSSNLTPLQDGLLVVVAIMAALVCGLVALRARARTADPEISARASTIIIITMVLWLVQILASEVFRSIPLTQLALTRSTPYAVLVLTALLAERACQAFVKGSDKDKLTGLLLVLGSMGAAFSSKLPLLGIPTNISPLIELDVFYQDQIVNHASLALIVAALAWWMWQPHLQEKDRRIWTNVLVSATIFSIVFFGLRTWSLAVGLILIMDWKPAWVSKIPATHIVIYGLLVVGIIFMLLTRNPWKFDRIEKVNDVVMIAKEHVPQDGMILVLPFRNSMGEFILPERATFLGWGESQYLFYDPPLAEEVWKRAALLGVEPTDSDPSCAAWLWKTMCRRQLFSAEARENNQVWRKNLKEIRKIAPSLSHVLMPQEMACGGDKIVARTNGLVLVPILGVTRCAG
jgi:hypothetical protein